MSVFWIGEVETGLRLKGKLMRFNLDAVRGWCVLKDEN